MGKAEPKKPGKKETQADGERDLLAAFHEAGHAVMAWHLGVRLSRVTIKSGVGTTGMTYLSGRLPKDDYGTMTPEMQRQIENYILVAVAGAIAEEIHTGTEHQIDNSVDIRNACLVAGILTPEIDEMEAFINWLQIRARNTLKFRWKVVAQVADELMRRKTLQAQTLQKVIAEALSSPRVTAPSRLPNDQSAEVNWGPVREER